MDDTLELIVELQQMAADKHQPACDADTLRRAVAMIEALRSQRDEWQAVAIAHSPGHQIEK